MMNMCAPVTFINTAIQPLYSSPVIPANAGIQKVCKELDSRLRGNDDMDGLI